MNYTNFKHVAKKELDYTPSDKLMAEIHQKMINRKQPKEEIEWATVFSAVALLGVFLLILMLKIFTAY